MGQTKTNMGTRRVGEFASFLGHLTRKQKAKLVSIERVSRVPVLLTSTWGCVQFLCKELVHMAGSPSSVEVTDMCPTSHGFLAPSSFLPFFFPCFVKKPLRRDGPSLF